MVIGDLFLLEYSTVHIHPLVCHVIYCSKQVSILAVCSVETSKLRLELYIAGLDIGYVPAGFEAVGRVRATTIYFPLARGASGLLLFF